MKRLWIFGLMIILLTACSGKPAFTDNGRNGLIMVVVFYDDNGNGIMDNAESGAQVQVAISQDVSCPPASDPKRIDTDAYGIVKFPSLKPGKYCVYPFGNYSMTTKLTQEVYISSDLVTTVMFGIVRE